MGFLHTHDVAYKQIPVSLCRRRCMWPSAFVAYRDARRLQESVSSRGHRVMLVVPQQFRMRFYRPITTWWFKSAQLGRPAMKPVSGDNLMYIGCECEGQRGAASSDTCGAGLAPLFSHNLLEARNAQAFSAPFETNSRFLPPSKACGCEGLRTASICPRKGV